MFKLTSSPFLVAVHNADKCAHDKRAIVVSFESSSYLNYTYFHFLAKYNNYGGGGNKPSLHLKPPL